MDFIKNYLVSVVRTAVPFIVASIGTWLATRNVMLSDDNLRMLTLFVEGSLGMAYYLLIRALEHVHYRFGWLLGYAKMPVYVAEQTPEAIKKAAAAAGVAAAGLTASTMPLHDALEDSNAD